jgi:hypothetical protein
MEDIIIVILEIWCISLIGVQITYKLKRKNKNKKNKKHQFNNYLKNKKKKDNNFKNKTKFISLKQQQINPYSKIGINWMIMWSLQLMSKK